ncbi:MAG: hypothetical protein JO157_01595 [Acetobacteraceae bacterium]|nr:hypothetical protein [Acetobacteraceae bacterium]
MLACQGRVQREGEVVHLVAERLEDLTGLLRSVGKRADAPSSHEGCGAGAGGDSGPARRGPGRVRDIYSPDRGPGPEQGIKVPTRDFR